MGLPSLIVIGGDHTAEIRPNVTPSGLVVVDVDNDRPDGGFGGIADTCGTPTAPVARCWLPIAPLAIPVGRYTGSGPYTARVTLSPGLGRNTDGEEMPARSTVAPSVWFAICAENVLVSLLVAVTGALR